MTQKKSGTPVAYPAPRRYVSDEPFWEAAAAGVLRYKECRACGEAHFHPRPHCPLCGSDDTVWKDASGTGTVHSFSILRAARRPTAAALVEIAEGPTIPTVIVDADLPRLAIGDEVVVRFEPAEDGTPVPVFTTVAAQRARAYSAETLARVTNVPGVDLARARQVATVGVVGAGTMGTGIATAYVAAGVPVVLVDRDQQALDRAAAAVRGSLDRAVSRGRLRADEFADLVTSTQLGAVAGADLVIEAVWEQRSLKEAVLAEVDTIVGPDAILATNTSTLDLDALAAATAHPDRVIGLHFFSPAHVMRLVEVVRGRETRADAVATAVTLTRQIGKTAVVVGNGPGFVGNRMMIARAEQARTLLLEGAFPEQIDRVVRDLGLPMGPYEMFDLGGAIELSYRRRQESGEEDWFVDELYRRGRLGQKTGAGYYSYPEGARRPVADPEVKELVVEASRRAGVPRRRIADAEIRDRLTSAMVEAGDRLLADGIALRPGDIDVVWREGFGWPTWKGGPMYDADVRGAR